MRVRHGLLGVLIACGPAYVADSPLPLTDGGSDAAVVADAGVSDASVGGDGGDGAIPPRDYFMRTLNRRGPTYADAVIATVPDGFPSGNSAMTVELWIRGKLPVTCTTNFCSIFSYGSIASPPALNTRRSLGINASKRFIVTQGGEAGVSTNAAHTLEDGLWHHVALVMTPVTPTTTNYSLFFDGDADMGANLTTATPATDTQFSIGANVSAEANGLTGDYAEVRVWNRTLTNSEIIAYKNQRRAPNTPNLIAYYDMVGRNGAALAGGTGSIVPNKAMTGTKFDAYGMTSEASGSTNPPTPSFEVGGPGLLGP